MTKFEFILTDEMIEHISEKYGVTNGEIINEFSNLFDYINNKFAIEQFIDQMELFQNI